MSRPYVDPRTDPDPGVPRPPARFTADPNALEGLHQFCRKGRLYDVERWIQAGRPLQLSPDPPADRRDRFRTALEIALDREDYSLVLLLAANGYDWSAEPESPLNTALRLRRRALLDLFLEWGADPQEMSVDALCDSYDSELYERFRSLGVDLTSGHSLASGLGYHTSNKPLFGFAKRHRLEEPRIQIELDIALAHHAWEGNEKGVMLCLWAGADPHALVPDLRWGLGNDEDEADRYSAVYAACSNGHIDILERLKPDPALDDYEELYRSARNARTVELLARSTLPRDPSKVVAGQLGSLAWPFRDDRPVDTLRALFEAGVRWEASPKSEIACVRRDVLRTDNWTFERVMKLLAIDDYCSREVLTELARTQAMRKRMKRLGLIPETRTKRSGFDHSRPARAREILAKFGVELPEEKKLPVSLPRTVQIGKWSRDGSYLRLDRPALFERVWSTPVEKLAREWGLSGRGLAKACRRLQVPVPPRGYWAKVAAGQHVRRPRLARLPAGQGEEILIRVPEPLPDQ